MTSADNVPIIGRPHAAVRRRGFDTAGESMGRGDARTRKGKIFRGSYGKTRPRKRKKAASATPAPGKTAARRP